MEAVRVAAEEQAELAEVIALSNHASTGEIRHMRPRRSLPLQAWRWEQRCHSNREDLAKPDVDVDDLNNTTDFWECGARAKSGDSEKTKNYVEISLREKRPVIAHLLQTDDGKFIYRPLPTLVPIPLKPLLLYRCAVWPNRRESSTMGSSLRVVRTTFR